jgi:malonyl-CoA/methylmalonyl-CoA synthetase
MAVLVSVSGLLLSINYGGTLAFVTPHNLSVSRDAADHGCGAVKGIDHRYILRPPPGHGQAAQGMIRPASLAIGEQEIARWSSARQQNGIVSGGLLKDRRCSIYGAARTGFREIFFAKRETFCRQFHTRLILLAKCANEFRTIASSAGQGPQKASEKPMNANLFSRLFDTVTETGRLAIEIPDGSHVSYGDLIERSGRVANYLAARGVKTGDRVAVQAEKSVQALVLYLAAVRAGAVYLPLNTAYTLTELEYFLGDAEPSLIVCDPSRFDGVSALAKPIGANVDTLDANGHGTLTDGAAKAKSEFATVERASDDLAAILYTSGTTGRSKGAMLTHDNLVSNSMTLVETWGFTDADVLIHALPIYHTHGLFVASNVTLFARASMIFLSKFDPNQVIDLMARATVMMGVPTFYTRLLQNPRLTRDATRHMRLFISGSAPLLAETHREWSAKTGHAVLERYGMTETNMNTSNPYHGDRVPGAVGLPLPGVAVRVTDPDTGTPLDREAIGMIEVKGPNVFKGYWRMPEKTRSEFRDDGFFITGDLGKIDGKGYVHILGRGKDLVISGGFNVYPKEVESEIDAVPGVIESAVIGVAHADFGEGVTAIVVADKTTGLNEDAIIHALDGRLAKFKMPKRVIFVDDLPRNTMGKVQKNVLRDTYAKLYNKKG